MWICTCHACSVINCGRIIKRNTQPVNACNGTGDRRFIAGQFLEVTRQWMWYGKPTSVALTTVVAQPLVEVTFFGLLPVNADPHNQDPVKILKRHRENNNES